MKFYLRTYGCQMNVRDSEAVAALLVASGHEWTDREEEAELVIVNSCTVRQKAENKAIGKVGYLCAMKRRADSAVKTVGLMGCAVARIGEARVREMLPGLDFCVRPGHLEDIPFLNPGADTLGAHPEHCGFSAFVTVMTGCDNCCSYCIVPKVRGHERSRPAGDILREVECLARRGVKEVTLLGQSVLKWHDGMSFPALLRNIAEIDGVERIRFTSAHPKGCTDELVAAYRDCPKICRHLHLPVQSGSDRILKEMGRRYTREEYLAAVVKLRDFDPEFSLTTDVIVGYPGETEADFEATRLLMDEAGFDNAFVFKYSPRPGTRSAALENDVSIEEKERRDQVLLADQERRGLERNRRLLRTVREVLVEGPSKRNANRLSGRDGGNRIVVWDADFSAAKPGSFVRLEIVEAHPQILIGKVV